MTRTEILAETVARLEAERYMAPVRLPQFKAPTLPPVTAEEAAENVAILLDGLQGDAVVLAWRERRAS